MGVLRCVDGSVLSVEAVTCRDRVGQPYEITLKLARDSVPFAAVGQRCGYQLSDLAARVSAARQDPEQAAAWPDPDDRFPAAPSAGAAGAADSGRGHRLGGARADRGGHGAGALPSEHEYFALRSHDRFDLPVTGELRCVLRSSAVWVGDCVGVGSRSQAGQGRQHGSPAVPGQQAGSGEPAGHGQQGGSGQPPVPEQRVELGQRSAPGPTAAESATGAARERSAARADPEGEFVASAQHNQRAWRQRPGGQGRWQLTRRAVIEAWGAGGVGVRAVLTSAELVAFLDTVLNGPDSAVATGEIPIEGPQTGGHLPDRSRVA